MDNDKIDTAPEPYEPPTVEDIPLRSEEQLLAGCKGPFQPGSNAFRCIGTRGICRSITRS
jgi:hypothetical protein